MQFSTKGRYAVMAMVDLTANEAPAGAGSLICLADIAHRQQRSLSYLKQLFGKPRRADLVCSTPSPGGSHRLARPSRQIAIADIVATVDKQIKVTRCEIGSGGCLLGAHPAEGSMGPNGEICQTTIYGSSSDVRSSCSCAASRWPMWL